MDCRGSGSYPGDEIIPTLGQKPLTQVRATVFIEYRLPWANLS